MNLDTATRTQLLVHVTTDFDPTTTTIDVKVDGTWHPATWITPPHRLGSTWKRTARTDDYFAGPDATANGATVLTVGDHPAKTRVTLGGQIITDDTDPITVN